MARFSVCYRLGLAALAVAVAAMAANAQPPQGRGGPPGGPGGFQGRFGGGFGGGPGGGGGGTLFLLMNDQIREELDLTEDQIAKLRQAGEKLRDGGGGQRPEFDREAYGKMTEAEREKLRAESDKRRQEMEQRVADMLKDILVPEQITRLEQISLQQQRTRALSNQKVIDALGITPDQQAKLRAIGEKAMEQAVATYQGMELDATEVQRNQAEEKRASIRTAAEKEAMGVLTAEQKGKLKELLGEPFELRMEPGRFQGRGDQPGGRGPGGRGGRGEGGDRPARPEN